MTYILIHSKYRSLQTIMTPQAQDANGQWCVQRIDWMREMKIPETVASPWCGQSTLSREATERVQSLVDCVVWAKLGLRSRSMSWSEKTEALKHSYVDTSQNHCRRPYTNTQGVTGTLTTSSHIYSFGRDSFILPKELLLWHGHSRAINIPDHVKASQLKALAGEGMSLPCIGSVLWSALLVRFESN